MKPRYRGAVVAVLAAVTIAGCGGEDSSQPLVQTAAETVGTVSEESAREPIVQDADALRSAMESDQFDENVNAIYAVINRAGEMSRARGDEAGLARGAKLIRAKVPPLVAGLKKSEPKVRQRVKSLRFRTDAGERLRDMALLLVTEQLRNFQSLGHALARSRLAWTPLYTWTTTNNALLRRANARVQVFMQSLSQHDRAVIDRAELEAFG